VKISLIGVDLIDKTKLETLKISLQVLEIKKKLNTFVARFKWKLPQ
jgi:hypothetical protein